jgi:hypothetical protein
LVLYMFLSSVIVLAQKPYELKPATDIYGLEVLFKKEIFTDKCDCCCSVFPKAKNCVLYMIEIKGLFLQRDSTVYSNGEDLKRVKYMIIPSSIMKDKPVMDSIYIVFSRNTCSEKVLIINQLAKERPETMPDYRGLAHEIGLGVCKKFTLFQKILLKFGIGREKIYRKAKDMPPNSSKFVKAIIDRD